jgi:hypothetical protein
MKVPFQTGTSDDPRERQPSRRRAELERAVYGGAFDPVATTLLIHLAQAEGDLAGALRARDHVMRHHGDQLPPEPW